MSVLHKLDRLRGVTWTWNQRAAEEGKTPGTDDAGVVAQEVEAVFPELVATSEKGHKQVSYTGLIGVLIQAVKELKAENDALATRVAALEQALAKR